MTSSTEKSGLWFRTLLIGALSAFAIACGSDGESPATDAGDMVDTGDMTDTGDMADTGDMTDTGDMADMADTAT